MKSAPSISTPSWVGPLCGMVAAVLYTLTNIALRDCVQVDAYLVSAVKAAPTVIFLGPLIAWAAAGKQPVIASKRRIPQFLVASFMAQFFGNAAFQKALEKIGLAASVPITLGVLIVGGAIFGVILLGESVNRQKMFSMATLIIAVVVLSIPNTNAASAETAVSESGSITATSVADAKTARTSDVLIGSLWAASSGLAYSFFGVTLRQTLQSGVKSTTAMFLSGLVGIVTLWPYIYWTLGVDAVHSTPLSLWGTMAVAGLCNFLAFIAITASLKLLPVVAVNLINASQVAMAAVAGVMLFGEPVTWTLLTGIFLTILGLVIMAKRPNRRIGNLQEVAAS